MKLTLDHKVLIQSTTGNYDAVLTCLDIPDLRHGFVPFSLEYASPPNAVVRPLPHAFQTSSAAVNLALQQAFLKFALDPNINQE